MWEATHHHHSKVQVIPPPSLKFYLGFHLSVSPSNLFPGARRGQAQIAKFNYHPIFPSVGNSYRVPGGRLHLGSVICRLVSPALWRPVFFLNGFRFVLLSFRRTRFGVIFFLAERGDAVAAVQHSPSQPSLVHLPKLRQLFSSYTLQLPYCCSYSNQVAAN
ncbi:unnamed protein product [Acanthosepion pharaonis]|uniref:Uncharacterized protein n=1 Tax=Acanthosepion pharaonis TaxID=158019 RepID=A0A812DNK6_ACAPH|nr:unnamed protein product [Sepia pharaonis]